MRLHALGIPPTITIKEYSCCAFTNQLRLFCNFMKESGCEVIHYGHEHSVVDCDEHVSVTYDHEMKRNYGDDYRSKQRFFPNNTTDEIHTLFNNRSLLEISKRKSSDFDIVLCFWGMGHYGVGKQLMDLGWPVVEPCIGYSHSFAKNRVFASYAIMNIHYIENKQDPCLWDTVIPHYVDPNEFEYSDVKDDYFLFMGRIIPSKGVGLILDLAKHTNKKIIIAGYGDAGSFYKDQIPKNVEFLGVVGSEQRKKLLSKAKALLSPSLYIEPGPLVLSESLISGTPVISTDWGGFVDNNKHGKTGFRCRTFGQFIEAINTIDKIDNRYCRDYAIKNFSTEYAKNRYIDYFSIVRQRYEHGFYFSKNNSNSIYESL